MLKSIWVLNMKIEMSFTNQTEEKKFQKKYFKDLAKVIFKHLNLDAYFIFEVNLVTINTIHQINKEYRHIDRPTDVISFAFEDEFNGENKIVPNSSLPRDLGAIFICVDACKQQAEEYQHSVDREMAFLATHGILHLLGYDHMKEEDEKVMFKIQDEIMDILKL